jgi:hypothetical protein
LRTVGWSIVDIRPVTSADQLTPLELDQLRVAGQKFDGEDRPPELRFVELPVAANEDGSESDEDAGCFALTGFLAVAKVYVDGTHRYDLWQIDPDAASLLLAGTTEVVAGRCQSTWMTPDLLDSYPDADALDEAMKAASIW